MLIALMVIPLAGAAGVALAPARATRRIAAGATLLPVAVAALALYRFDWVSGHEIQGEGAVRWLPELGLDLSVGADAVAMLLVALTVLLGPICVYASFSAITEKVRTYYFWLLVLQAAMTGVFIARDLLLFYICFEFTLLPMYVLIAIYGSTNRARAATRFFLYTFTGSMIALAGLVYVMYFNATFVPPAAVAPSLPQAGEWTLDVGALQAAARFMSPTEQAWVLLALVIGFAVKVPLFPLHTWLPLAHTEAPTAGSVILAGVLLKLGTYGLYRFVLPMTPLAIVEFAPTLAVLAIIGIIYAGLICWVQTDVKKLVAYSSVSHLGFCVLGLVAINQIGMTGSVLYMVNHGLSTGALFLLIGMIYERYHTRSMRELGGLARRMPIWATFMVFFTMASVGLPGLNGFVSEFLCLLGAFQAGKVWGDLPGATGIMQVRTLGPWFAAIAGTGMIVAAIYLLYMVGRVVFGPLHEPHGHHDHATQDTALPPDLTRREIAVLLPLAALCLLLGVYPRPVIRGIDSSIAETIAMVESGATMTAQSRAESSPRPASHNESTTIGGHE